MPYYAASAGNLAAAILLWIVIAAVSGSALRSMILRWRGEESEPRKTIVFKWMAVVVLLLLALFFPREGCRVPYSDSWTGFVREIEDAALPDSERTRTYVIVMAGGLVLAAVAICCLFVLLRERQRAKKLKEVSEQMGWAFHPRGDWSLMDRLSLFHLFSQGFTRRIKNIVHGRTERAEVAIFDCEYADVRKSKSRTHWQSVVYFRSSSLDLPPFALRPENLFHKIGKVLGYQDIDFVSHPKFSQDYLLRSHDEEGVRRVFREQVLWYFEQQRGVCTEGVANQLIFYRTGQRIKPDGVGRFMEEGFRVFELFEQS